MSSDPPRPTLAQLETAAATGRLGAWCERLVDEQAWGSLESLLAHAATEALPLDALDAIARAIHAATDRDPEPRPRTPLRREHDRLRAEAARAIARRVRRTPPTPTEEALLRLAGELWLASGASLEAGELFERLGLDEQAAEAWARAGEIERLEACHARLDERRGAEQRGRALYRQVERLCLGGARAQAARLMAALPAAVIDRAGLADLQAELGGRLLRGHALSLRREGELQARLASGLPATLGRDLGCEIVLRDPGISRRHARLVPCDDRVALADAGSRGGTWLGGARLAAPPAGGELGPAVPLAGPLRFRLGERCELDAEPAGACQVLLRARGGIDRELVALAGAGDLALQRLFPELEPGFALRFDDEGARLVSAPGHAARIDGAVAAGACELLAGDRIELGEATGRTLLRVGAPGASPS